MSDEERPIAWLALDKGTPIFSSDGQEIGRVTEIVADEAEDIFSGLVVRSGLIDMTPQLIPADTIESLTNKAVRLNIPEKEARALPIYEG